MLLAAAATLAQPAADKDPAAAPATEQKATGAAGQASGNTDAPAGTPARSSGSPSDYRASEEISEDRPVSFPVDI
jgi:hypothetical protein